MVVRCLCSSREASSDSVGVSLAALLNYTEDYRGLQLAPVNYAKGGFLGWQVGAVNYAADLRGLQTDVVNSVGTIKGLQVGVFHLAEDTHGALQIGVLNIIASNHRWFRDLPREVAPGMVFVNWRF